MHEQIFRKIKAPNSQNMHRQNHVHGDGVGETNIPPTLQLHLRGGFNKNRFIELYLNFGKAVLIILAMC